MAHRKDEKERRRAKRLAKEQEAAAAAARRQRLNIAFVVVLVALIGGSVAMLAGAFSGDVETEAEPRSAADVQAVELPAQEIGDLTAAAKVAKCEVENPRIEDATHEDRVFTAADYKTNPPTSGKHNPVWYEDGIYEAGNAPDLGMQVHTLEHGRINIQYAPGTPAETVAQLEALVAEQSDGYHMLLYENVTDMPFEVAATAWGHSVSCKTMNDKVFDAFRTFRNEHIDQGPENVP